MTKPYTHLTQEERYRIHAYKKAEFTNSEIAHELVRNVSTIKRELSRNTGLRDYRPQQAQCLAQNRHQTKPKQVKMAGDMMSVLRMIGNSNGVQNKYKINCKTKD